LVAGLVVPVAAIGFIAEFSLPLVLLADLLFVIFIWKLSSKFRRDVPEETKANV